MSKKSKFNIPIALFIFKRAEKAALIIDQISKIKPSKIYLIGDGPRHEKEKHEVEKCREYVESHITWACEIIRNYAETNRGVYENIAGGAKWVFEQEPMAIFLEDDNFPATSFFYYCEELLLKYKNDTRILWICGTNYMGKSDIIDNSDYFFTQTMLPCGWASWSEKFLKYYDGEIRLYRNANIKDRIKQQYSNTLLYEHDFPSWDRIIYDIDNNNLPNSWDFQMAFALRVHNLFGIAPKYNQISNIGADALSIHGGVSMDNVMTARFCEVPIYELTFPLKHPVTFILDRKNNKMLENKIIFPFNLRVKLKIARFIKKLFHIKQEESIKVKLMTFFNKNHF